jgi:hypothetical protein
MYRTGRLTHTQNFLDYTIGSICTTNIVINIRKVLIFKNCMPNDWFANASQQQPSRDKINVLQQKMIEHLNQFVTHHNNQQWSHESRAI